MNGELGTFIVGNQVRLLEKCSSKCDLRIIGCSFEREISGAVLYKRILGPPIKSSVWKCDVHHGFGRRICESKYNRSISVNKCSMLGVSQ